MANRRRRGGRHGVPTPFAAGVVIILVVWGGTIAINGALDFIALAKPMPIEAEFIDRPALGTPPVAAPPDGDVLLTVTSKYRPSQYGPIAEPVEATWAIPLRDGKAGDPIKILDTDVYDVAPGGRYVVDPGYPTDQFIRLRDRRMVLDLRAGSHIFIDDHRVLAFAFSRNYGYGGAAIIDLDAGTIEEFDTTGLTMAVVPRFVLDGKVDLCEQQDISGGSGPTCVSYRTLDLDSGDSSSREADPPPVVTDDGEYAFAKVWASRTVGDRVVYFPGERTTIRGSQRGPLRWGGRDGPQSSDPSGLRTDLVEPSIILATTDANWVIANSWPSAGEPQLAVCDTASLACSQLNVAQGTTARGIVPASVLG